MKSVFLVVLVLIVGSVVYFNRDSLFVRVDQTRQRLEPVIETIHPLPTYIQTTGLPDRHLIEAPFVPQAPEKNWDQPWQDACEEASLLTVRYYYHSQNPDNQQIVNDLQSLLDSEASLGLSHDVNLREMALVAADLWSYRTQIIDDPTLEDIKQSISQNIPIIVPANGKTLFKENKRFRNGGPWYHNLVILGYDDTKQIFIVHDVGTQFGAYFRYTYDTLMDSIHDFPDSGRKEDIDQGPSRILLLIK